MHDPVNKPAHYNKGKVECIDAIESAVSDLHGIEAVCTANAIKYLYRWKAKDGAESLKKARWYIDRLITTLEVSDTGTDRGAWSDVENSTKWVDELRGDETISCGIENLEFAPQGKVLTISEPIGYTDLSDVEHKGHDFWVSRQPGKNTVPVYLSPKDK